MRAPTTGVILRLVLVFGVSRAQFVNPRNAYGLELDEYESEEMVPLTRRMVRPDPAYYKRNYRSNTLRNAPMLLAPPTADGMPSSSELARHLKSLLNMAQLKATAREHPGRQPEPKHTTTEQRATQPTTSEVPSTTTMRTSTSGTTDTTEVPRKPQKPTQHPRDVARKWFPVLLNEAIQNVLHNDTRYDELDELVDQIAAGSRTYGKKVSPMQALVRNVHHHGATGVNPMQGPVLMPLKDGRPPAPEWQQQVDSAVPYVVNIFNNTHIGYIIMRIANDSDIRIEKTSDEAECNLSRDVAGRQMERLRSDVEMVDFVDSQTTKTTQSSHKLTSRSTAPGSYGRVSHLPRTTPTLPSSVRPATVDPPFFNLLQAPEKEPITYRVLLRNPDAHPEKQNMRLAVQVPGTPGRSGNAGKVPVPVERSRKRTNALPKTLPKHQPLFSSEESSTSDQHEDRSKLLTTPDRSTHRRFPDYESLEEDTPYDETEFFYPDSTVPTERTAKFLSAARSSGEQKRSSWKPFAQTRRYNFRRKFGSAEVPDSQESWRTSTTPFAVDDRSTTKLMHQATTSVYVKRKKDSRHGTDRSPRKQFRLSAAGGPLKLAIDTTGETHRNELLEMGVGKIKRSFDGDPSWTARGSSSEDSRGSPGVASGSGVDAMFN